MPDPRPMLHYLCSSGCFRTLRDYLQFWEPALNSRFWFVPYEKLPSATRLGDGVFITADVERLTDETTARACALWDALARRGNAVRLLNHPSRSMRRYELLRTLEENGRNAFAVRRLDEPRDGLRYPVFVRSVTEHEGTYTPLLEDAAALDAAVDGLLRAGRSSESLLIVEYCDVRDADGIVHKYSAFRVGDRIIPRHVFFGRKWCLKKADLREPEHVAREREYLQTNPHAAELRQIFDLARIDYGRIDYAVVENRIVVWEINTNPTVLTVAHRRDRARSETHEQFAHEFAQSLLALLPGSSSTP